MNAVDVLKYGHLTVLRAVKGLPEADWTTGGVCGYWSVKEIIAHLASFEFLLVEAMEIAAGNRSGHGPYLSAWFRNGQAYNDEHVPARAGLSLAETLEEFEAIHQQTMAQADALEPGRFRRNGFLPAYGAEYDLEDFIAYTFYGHKREHAAQIAVFRDAIKR